MFPPECIISFEISLVQFKINSLVASALAPVPAGLTVSTFVAVNLKSPEIVTEKDEI